MLLGPAADLLERRQQGAARVGELVDDGDGWPFIDGSADKPRVGQLAEPIGKHRVADAFDCTGERTKAARAAAQRPQHDPGPTLAEELECT